MHSWLIFLCCDNVGQVMMLWGNHLMISVLASSIHYSPLIWGRVSGFANNLNTNCVCAQEPSCITNAESANMSNQYCLVLISAHFTSSNKLHLWGFGLVASIVHEPWVSSSFLWYLPKVELRTSLIIFPFILRVGCDILEIWACGAQVRHNYADRGLLETFSMKSKVQDYECKRSCLVINLLFSTLCDL